MTHRKWVYICMHCPSCSGDLKSAASFDQLINGVVWGKLNQDSCFYMRNKKPSISYFTTDFLLRCLLINLLDETQSMESLSVSLCLFSAQRDHVFAFITRRTTGLHLCLISSHLTTVMLGMLHSPGDLDSDFLKNSNGLFLDDFLSVCDPRRQ